MDSGNVAWILASSALVCMMIPALALFYGGMVGSRRILNMMMMCFGGASLVAVLWALFGYSMAFGNSVGGLGLIGDITEFPGMGQLLVKDDAAAIPGILFAAFQLFFACVTTALVAGAAAGRMKFGAWMLFAGIWATIVYFPIAHWVFAFSSADGTVTGGWIANGIKAIDFAGGTAVHMNAGAAALALALVLGKSSGWPKMEHTKPHSRPLVLLGAGLLWVGWFGFNAGSALAAGTLATSAFVATHFGAAAAALGWSAAEGMRNGKGNGRQLLNQATGVGLAWVISIVGTLVILFVVDKTIGLRVSAVEEETGLDLSQHGEEGYDWAHG
ncbi:MAG: hypothetical protein NVS3B6_16560 [Pseudarthrobacter sp.]